MSKSISKTTSELGDTVSVDTLFQYRYFSAKMDHDGNIISLNSSNISDLTDQEVKEFLERSVIPAAGLLSVKKSTKTDERKTRSAQIRTSRQKNRPAEKQGKKHPGRQPHDTASVSYGRTARVISSDRSVFSADCHFPPLIWNASSG